MVDRNARLISTNNKLKKNIVCLTSRIKAQHRDNHKKLVRLDSYQQIFNKSREAILILENQQFIDVNNTAVKLFGYPEKSRLLNTTPSCLSPDFQEDGVESSIKEHRLIDIALVHGSVRFTWTYLRFDGSLVPGEVILTVVSSKPVVIIYTILPDTPDEHIASGKSNGRNVELLGSMLESINAFVWEIDLQARYTYVSSSVENVLGYSSDEMLGTTPFYYILDKTRTHAGEQIFHCVQNGTSFKNIEKIYSHKNGVQVQIESSGMPVFDAKGIFAGYWGVDQDISEKQHNEEQLILSEIAIVSSFEGIAITDPEGKIQRVNKVFSEITGYSFEEVCGKNPRILKSNRHNKEFYRKMWKDLTTTGRWCGDIWNRRKNGSVYLAWLSISAVKNKTGETINYMSVFHDLSGWKKNEEQLEFLSLHDPLTKLPNRRLFYDRLNVSIQTSMRTGDKLALLRIGIDNFKHINNAYGHLFGDELLCQITERINAICRCSDTFARDGGDEFVIILNQLSSIQEALVFSNRLIDLFKTAFSVLDEDIFTSISIGLAIFPDDGRNAIAMEKSADLALNKAKNEGGRQVYSFHKELEEVFHQKLYLINSLHQAVKDFSSFSMVYQPKVDAEKKIIKGVEALIRWDLNGVMISPGEFIPIAEDTNLIIPLGDWILRKALSDMKKVHASGYPEITFSINISTKQFKNNYLFSTIEALTSEFDIRRSKLFLEITESAPLDDVEEAIEIMKRFNAIGINFSMDDFGTGHSSLGHLKKFPLKELKIDRLFITDIPGNKNDVAISETIINMAKTLGCQVVAEGVENEAQLAFLKKHGCHLIQGYLFYKPMSLENLFDCLKQPVNH